MQSIGTMPPQFAVNRGSVITASKRPPNTATAPPREKRLRAIAQPLKLPVEVASLLGPLADSFNRLTDCEERIDQAIARGKHELRTTLSGVAEGKEIAPALNACSPRQILRCVRVFVSSTYDPGREELDPAALAHAAARGEEPAHAGAWSLQVLAAIRTGKGDSDSAFSEHVPLHRFFDIVQVQIAAQPQTIKTEWRATEGEEPHCPGIVITRTTPSGAPAPSELPSRIALRLKQRSLSSGAGPVAPLARVSVSRSLAALLQLAPESHYSYIEVEEALWLFVRDRGLLEANKRDGSAALRVGNHAGLASALGIDPRVVRLLTLSELHRHLHPQLKLWEPPPLMHTIVPGTSTSVLEVLLPDDEPLHQHRHTALNRLTAMDAKRPSALAPLDLKLEHTLRKLVDVADKRRWLQALLFADEDDADDPNGAAAADEEADPDEAGDKVQVKMEAESPEDVAATAAALALPAAAAAATGRRLRPLSGFARALLNSNLHAATHALRPHMLTTPCLPPPLPAEHEAPPPPDPTMRAFDGPWTAFAIRAYLADSQRRRRPTPG
jgi:hypothetical protein